MFWVQNINYKYFYLQLLKVLQYSSAQCKITRGVGFFLYFLFKFYIRYLFFCELFCMSMKTLVSS